MRQRRDEPDLLAGFVQPHIARRPTRPMVQVSQAVLFRQLSPQVFKAPVLPNPVFTAKITHGHHFDERKVHVAFGAPFGQAEEFIFIEAFQRHCVDLDPKARLLCRVDPVQHLRQAAPAGHAREFFLVQRIERHIDPLDPGRRQIVRKPRELRSVRRQGQFSKRTALQMPGHGPEKRHDIPPHQRLSAGDAQFFDAHPDESRTHPVKLFQRQKLFLRQEGHVFRHAVDTAEIAAIRHRNAQIADRSGKGVYERRHGHGRKRLECAAALRKPQAPLP